MKNLTKTTLVSLVTVTALSLGAWATCAEDVDMGDNNIINVADPVNAQDVATKAYVDELIAKLDLNPAQRYSRNDDKMIVTDKYTALMWQDNADVADNTKFKQWLTDDDFAVCKDDASSDVCNNNPPKEGTAQKYCFDLNLGGYGDWRLPSKDELVGIVKKDVGPPTISGVFQNIGFIAYWSSTTDASYTNGAWNVYFGDDNYSSSYNIYYKLGNLNVRCVREGQ